MVDKDTVDTVASGMDDKDTVDIVASGTDDTDTVDTVASGTDDMALKTTQVVRFFHCGARVRSTPNRFVMPFHLLAFYMILRSDSV